ncbi:tRNA (adenine(22)-N(1))-methyltransferase TrmK [uncultured Shewanella sp.]|uniref:tRNA (adenine(22)-N(1))-methyltransferase TrmK n=1 Tax=uncultured Shewanella sp. TaxID=173975 RepID=UPI00263435A6|nr:tRNA (adenine(22)-N(1))-methyltransferase TrmK [uncultured Shewanella sp.]
MKLNPRLHQINHMITRQYAHIWDCCCDHGLLGAALLDKQAAPHIHFVDTVPHVIAKLEDRLRQFYPQLAHNNQVVAPSQWHTHCLNAKNLPLVHSTQPQLIIIAGVGGDLTLEIIEHLLQSHPNIPVEFLICPVHHHFKVRRRLKQLEIGLVDEYLIKDNQRFYEIIHVSTQANTPLATVGNKMWDLNLATHQDYLKKTITHYQNMAKGRTQTDPSPIRAYQALLAQIS